jgi:hypothetical protein
MEIKHGNLQLEAGRFEMAYGDHLVIGNVGWHQVGRSFDGLRLRHQAGDKAPRIDAFFTAIGEGFAAEIPVGDDIFAGDTYFTGVYAGLGSLVGGGRDLDAYLLARIFPGYDEAGGDLKRAGEVTVGSRFKGKFGSVDLRAEAGIQAGTRRVGTSAPKVFAQQADLEVGVAVAGSGRIAVEGFFASGDDPTTATDESWNHLYPTAHKWLGFMDIIGARKNVAGGALHLGYKAAKKWKLRADSQMFWRVEDGGGDSYVGTEVYGGLVRILGAGLTMRGGYGIFLPNGDDDSLRHFVEIELKHTL